MKWCIPLVVLLVSSSAFAQTPPIQTIPSGNDKIVSLQLGQPAPFSGQLFDPPTALRWANWLQQYKYRLEFDTKLVGQQCVVETGYRDRLLEIEKARAAVVEKDLQARLLLADQARANAEKEAANPAWYRTVWFGAGIGIATGLIFTSMSIWAIKSSAQ
jgi:hypothetical protein